MAFHGNIDVRWLKPGRERLMLNSILHVSKVDGLTTFVPGGFITDGASVPKLLWNILDPFGALLPAAIVHDYHYVMRGITKRRADLLFREIVQDETGIGTTLERLAYQAVRRFGNGGDEWPLLVPKEQDPAHPDFM